jgi:Ni/Co efflux regulator RcnB
MKRLALVGLSALTLATAFTGAASAQQYDHRSDWGRNEGRDGRYSDRPDARFDNRNNGWDRQYGEDRQWRRGDRLPYGYEGRYREVDWRREHFRSPPYGYRYVRDDRGETLLVGIATGAILGVMLSGH